MRSLLSSVARLAELPASLRASLGRARIAFGSPGLKSMIGAAMAVAVCFAVSCWAIASSLHRTDVDQHRQAATGIGELDRSIRQVVHDGLTMALGYSPPIEGHSPMVESWSRFRRALDSLCTRPVDSRPQAQRLRRICETRGDLYRELTPEMDSFDPPRHLFQRSTGRRLLWLREEIAGLNLASVRDSDRMIEQMVGDYHRALWTLAFSTSGFIAAGITLLALLGSASTRYHDQWRKTRKARNLLSETIEALPAGVLLFDRDDRLMMFNNAAAASSPVLKRPGIVGTKYADIALEGAKLANEFGHPLLSTPEEWIARFRSKGLQRTRQPVCGRWFEWSERLTASGRTVGLRVDITDLKQYEIELESAQARLEEEMSRLRSIIESSGASVILTDRDLRILAVNHEFANLHGLTVDAAIGRPLGDIVSLTLDHRVLQKWRSASLEAVDTGAVRYSKTITNANGLRRIYSITAKPVVDETDTVRQIVFLGVDDTERREAERALADADRLATVGEMAATVVHEINQPLQVINLAAASALDELTASVERGDVCDAAYLKGRFERIAQQVERAARITSSLRGFVHCTTTGQVTLLDVGEAMRNAVDLASHTLRKSRIAPLRMEEDMPPVVGHGSRLEQVLINLINNARDAGASTIEVFAGTIEREGRRFVRLAVEDTGPGVPDDLLPRLFHEFVTTKPKIEGTGLGLRICRRIVEEMGGTIAVSNRPEGGARFEILLPAVDTVR